MLPFLPVDGDWILVARVEEALWTRRVVKRDREREGREQKIKGERERKKERRKERERDYRLRNRENYMFVTEMSKKKENGKYHACEVVNILVDVNKCKCSVRYIQ